MKGILTLLVGTKESLQRQILLEFGLPALGGIAWWAYVFVTEPHHGKLSVKGFLDIFVPGFLFVWWLLAQVLRIMKQRRVEGGLSGIERSVQDTVQKLAATSEDLVGHIRGGKSVCFLVGSADLTAFQFNFVSHASNDLYPVFDVNMSAVDHDGMRTLPSITTVDQVNQFRASRTVSTVLLPGTGAQIAPIRFPIGDTDVRRFGANFFARNGTFNQVIVFRRLNGHWQFATRVMKDSQVAYEQVPEGFPRDATGSVEWQLQT